jgi:hypothetical protein
MGTNVRVLFPEEIGIGATQDMLAKHGLHVHDTRCDLRAKHYRIAVQDLLLMQLHFGQGDTYNEALADGCNQALRYREAALKKRA